MAYVMGYLLVLDVEKGETNMLSKYFALTFIALVSLAFAGCPVNVEPQVPLPVVDDPVIDPVVEPAIPDGMGEVVVQGNLLDNKAIADWNTIVDFLRPRVTRMEFWFYQSLPSADPVTIEDVKGGGPDGTKHFSVDVVGSLFQAKFLLNLGVYDVWISAEDQYGRDMFYDNSSVEVLAGQTSTLSVMFGLNEYFDQRVVVNGLPGEYGEYGDYGQVMVTDGAGNQYSGQYFRYYPMGGGMGKAAMSYIVFSVYLPIDFDGETDGGALIITDDVGDVYATELNINIFDIESTIDPGAVQIDYNFPDWMSGVDAEFGFVHYPVLVG